MHANRVTDGLGRANEPLGDPLQAVPSYKLLLSVGRELTEWGHDLTEKLRSASAVVGAEPESSDDGRNGHQAPQGNG